MKTRMCVVCGKQYQARTWTSTGAAICSPECREVRRQSRLKRVAVSCQICGKELILEGRSLARANRGRIVCSRECRSVLSSRTMAATNRRHAAARMAKNNPMRKAETRAKVSAALRAMGWKPPDRGGNGQLTLPQEMLAEALDWPTEVVVTIGMPGWGFANAYKLDVGNPDLKIGVEVDGNSHKTVEGKERDRKKETALAIAGWRLLRFWNEEVLTDLESCIAKVRSSTWK